MHLTSRVIPPDAGIISVPSLGLPFFVLDVGDLSSLEPVSGCELSALGSTGHHPRVRRPVKPAFEKPEC